MAKRITNIVLLLISIGIVLFIVHAFYSVFTREPQSPTTETPAAENTVSGQIVGSGQNANTSVENAFDDTSAPLPGLATGDTPKEDNPEEENATASDNDTSATDAAAQPTPQKSSTEDNTAEAGQAINQNPKLRNALPPVPVAPPSTSSETATDKFPTPVNQDTGNSFPAPTSGSSNSSFPTPSNSFPAPNTGTNNSFPAPAAGGFPAPVENNSFPTPQ